MLVSLLKLYIYKIKTKTKGVRIGGIDLDRIQVKASLVLVM